MYTPQEVAEKKFPKAAGQGNGYSMMAVDEFLDGLTEDYTALYKENAELKARLKVRTEDCAALYKENAELKARLKALTEESEE